MFTNEEAQQFAESIYQSWKAGDTASDRWNWFMVRMDQSDQDLCAKRLEREQKSDCT